MCIQQRLSTAVYAEDYPAAKKVSVQMLSHTLHKAASRSATTAEDNGSFLCLSLHQSDLTYLRLNCFSRELRLRDHPRTFVGRHSHRHFLLTQSATALRWNRLLIICPYRPF